MRFATVRVLVKCVTTPRAREWTEFTQRERRLWERYLDAVVDLKPAFLAEGNAELDGGMQDEATHRLEAFEEGGIRRYLYVAAAPGTPT